MVWLGVFGTRRQLIVGLVALALSLLVPFAVFGEPRYPPSALRSALLSLMVAALTGLTMQRLLAEVRSGRDRLAGVLDAATETAIVAVHASGAPITLFNRGAERMLGYRADEVVGVASPGLFLDRTEIGERAARARRRARVRGLRHRPAARGRGDAAVDLRAQGRPSGSGSR